MLNLDKQNRDGDELEQHELPGVCIELGQLGEGALVTEGGLAAMFGKHPVSVRRAVERGELPPPTRLMGKPVWTVGTIRRHIEGRLEAEARERKQLAQTLSVMCP